DALPHDRPDAVGEVAIPDRAGGEAGEGEAAAGAGGGGAVPGDFDPLPDGPGEGRSGGDRRRGEEQERGAGRRGLGARQHAGIHPEPLSRSKAHARSCVGFADHTGDATMTPRTDCEGFHRRDFLQVGAAGLLGLSLPTFLAAEAKARASGTDNPKARAKSVILVWLAGGPATIDMWDNKPDAPEGVRGEFKSIPTAAKGVAWSEHLPKMAAAADKVTVVRSLYHTIPSHAPATVFMTTGNKPTAALSYPSMGSVAAKMLSTEVGVPPYVTFGDIRNGSAGLAGYLGTGYNPFLIEGNAG